MDGDEQPEATTASALFGLVWNELVDVLGSSATATLLRRAAKHGAVQRPELMKLTIHKPLFEARSTRSSPRSGRASEGESRSRSSSRSWSRCSAS